jgi:outer membrane protein
MPVGKHALRAAALMAAALAGSKPAGAETLAEALALAWRTNPTISAERARQRATRELKPQALANALPQVSADASYSRLKDEQTRSATVFGPGGTETVTLNPLNASVDGALPVFTGFRNINAIRQARARIRAGGADLARVEQEVLRLAATAYFDVLRADAVYQSSQNNLEVLTRQKREADLRFEVGEVTRTDVAQADARLALSRSNLAASQAQLAVARARYAELIGQPPGSLEQRPSLPELPDTLESAIALAGEYAPSVVAARERETAARRQIAIAKGAVLPTVAVTAGYSYADEPSTFVTKDEQFSYGLRASVPIFSGGLNLSRIREARALHENAEHEIIEAERAAEAAVTSAFEQLIAARIAIRSATAQLEANELALEGVRREAQLGTRSTLDVLNAEQEFLDSRVSLADAERNERAASFSLLAASGLLTAEAVGITTEDADKDR